MFMITPEDTLHALWQCLGLSSIWDSDSMWDFLRITNFNQFEDLVKFVIDKGKNLEIFAFLVWTIWYRRNLLCTSNTPYPITQVLPNEEKL